MIDQPELAPWVGAVSTEHRAVCVCAPTPAHPDCGEQATTHVAVCSGEHDALVALSACDRHAPMARASGHLWGEHPHGLWCGLPSTAWSNEGLECVPISEEVHR